MSWFDFGNKTSAQPVAADDDGGAKMQWRWKQVAREGKRRWAVAGSKPSTNTKPLQSKKAMAIDRRVVDTQRASSEQPLLLMRKVKAKSKIADAMDAGTLFSTTPMIKEEEIEGFSIRWAREIKRRDHAAMGGGNAQKSKMVRDKKLEKPKKDVIVYRLMACGTVEEKIYRKENRYTKGVYSEVLPNTKTKFGIHLLKTTQFLESLGTAGIGNHNLLFSKTAPVPVVQDDELTR
ncbi:hypothetical protein L2E82_49376 [Cichorium intybus]|uniref:Uncharacterized protein n=1 Tax=Cichorium intybus TaxID=13427 RepID=A0ACB8Z042_CICIN|nr:hypothetical protein L2E82_49376 [Cichorium intybus]